MTVEQFSKELSYLSSPGPSFKPHKYLALLAVVKLVRAGVIQTPRIPFDENFRATFSALLKQFGSDIDRDRPHAPFFHLSSHSFWHLMPLQGQEAALDAATTVGSAGALQRLVSCAELEQSVFDFLKDSFASERVERLLEKLIRAGLESRAIPPEPREAPVTTSLFAHEAATLESIRQYVKSHGLGVTLQNLELHDPQSNRYFEIDLIVLSQFGVYVVELKHWSGRIEICPNSWLQNGSFFKPDPHKVNDFKAKLLRGIYERKFPQFPSIYFESVVVLTNPDVDAKGATIPTTTAHNPTFDSIDRFLKYLNNQWKTIPHRLSESQYRAFGEYVQNLHTPGAPRDFVFPGYEVVERLYQHVDRAEVIARRTDLRHRKLCRLRIFYPASGKSESDRRRAHERATATLNAVQKVGDHPNILKVWDIPNENNYLVEGSDWSETGTLRDVLDREEVLSHERATRIATGLARGLHAMYQQYVVHRTLSPESILMVDDVPKLMNFDLSFQLEDDRVTVIPDATKLKRTPYIAPEIYGGDDIPEGTADLFSVGVILYEMLTGKRPFACSTDLEQSNGRLADSHRQELAKQQVPANLVELVFDLVQQDPSNRPSNALALLQRLEASQQHAVVPPVVNRQLAPGERSGLYEIETFIARGAESQVYRAWGLNGRRIALKLFDRDVPRPRVVNEHRFSGVILHPGLVRVDSYGQWTDERFFIAFHWIEWHLSDAN